MEPQLTTLNRDIAQLEVDAVRLNAERNVLAKGYGRLVGRHRYLHAARAVRKPSASMSLWPLAVFAVGPLLVGVCFGMILSLLFSSGTAIIAAGLLGMITGAVIFALLLYFPPDALLANSIPATAAEIEVARTRLDQKIVEVTDVNQRLQTLLATRRDLAAGDKLQRAMLLQRNWKAMRGAEWEDFVVEVCRTLGANVHRAENITLPNVAFQPTTGPRGVIRRPPTQLFVTFSPRRLAVAAPSEVRPFHTAAVQQTINDLAEHDANALAIITNCRLTAGSKELARNRNCTLIGEDEFPDFVLGKLTL